VATLSGLPVLKKRSAALLKLVQLVGHTSENGRAALRSGISDAGKDDEQTGKEFELHVWFVCE